MTSYLQIPGIDAAIKFDESGDQVAAAVLDAMKNASGVSRFSQGNTNVFVNFNTVAAVAVTEQEPTSAITVWGTTSAISIWGN